MPAANGMSDHFKHYAYTDRNMGIDTYAHIYEYLMNIYKV